MYIMNQNGTLTVNSTKITSIQIDAVECKNPFFAKEYPMLYLVNSYGKRERSYRLGIYLSMEEATESLKKLHRAIDDRMKTFQFDRSELLHEYGMRGQHEAEAKTDN